MNIPPVVWFLVASLASFTLSFMHGVNGQRSFVSPLSHTALFPTSQWGDEDMSRRIFAVTWHMVTLAFGSLRCRPAVAGCGRARGESAAVVHHGPLCRFHRAGRRAR